MSNKCMSGDLQFLHENFHVSNLGMSIFIFCKNQMSGNLSMSTVITDHCPMFSEAGCPDTTQVVACPSQHVQVSMSTSTCPSQHVQANMSATSMAADSAVSRYPKVTMAGDPMSRSTCPKPDVQDCKSSYMSSNFQSPDINLQYRLPELLD